ncbi:MAG: metallophosphatase domain-containing protein [Promethearchaeota archaeon]
MKIVCISDTHGFQEYIKVPEGDILIIAGDISMEGKISEIKTFNDFLGQLNHKYKILIAGNHDFLFEEDRKLAEKLMSNAIYLQDEMIEIEGVKIYGTPWCPEFGFMRWAFTLPRGAPLRNVWKDIPHDIDFLVSHGPPYEVLDYALYTRTHEGSVELKKIVEKVKPKYHLFGHIHEAYGTFTENGINYINCSVLNEEYIPSFSPVVIDY